MFASLLALQVLTLLLLAFVAMRRPKTPAGNSPDPRLEALLGAELPVQIVRHEARIEGLERLLRTELGQLRQQTNDASARLQESSQREAEHLRTELRATLAALAAEYRSDAERLRDAVDTHHTGLGRRLTDHSADTARHHTEMREGLHTRLSELARLQVADGDKLREAVAARLDRLNEANTAKLEEMRATVDEKLHSTLQTRLTESFGTVTDQLAKVHTGLGEMTKLSAGVDDLSRIFTNVKSRGGFAEVQLGMLLSQMLAPAQFSQNVHVKPHSGEMVEYAVKLPTPQGEVLLPIDAKFPREAWERLETAYAGGTPAEIAVVGRAFENAIRTEARRICDKYIATPVTTNFALMFLPTEGLYAEVMRRDGLQSDIQQNCRVTIAGPSTLSALLNSFQMGFHMIHLQEKGDEVWKVLANARTQFGKFEALMGKMDDHVSKVQKTIQELGTRTRVINKALRHVQIDEAETQIASGEPGRGHEELLPMLVANRD